MNRVSIEFDSKDVANNYRFANNILQEFRRIGLPMPANDKSRNPIEITASHILHNLGLKRCRVDHYSGGNGLISFFKQ